MSTDNSNGVQTSKVANFFSVTGWWYASAALMLVVGIGIIVILMLPAGDSNPATQPISDTPVSPLPSSATEPEATPTATAAGWDDLGCNDTQGSTDIPTLPPKATWEPIGTLSAPASAKYGPVEVSGYVRSCYQHTPTGALLAASNILVVARLVPEPERVAVLSALMTPGPGRATTIEGGTPESVPWRFSAFRVESCSPARCNIRFVTSIGAAVGYADLSMVWSGGDWLLDGAQEPQGGPLESVPAGYATWGV